MKRALAEVDFGRFHDGKLSVSRVKQENPAHTPLAAKDSPTCPLPTRLLCFAALTLITCSPRVADAAFSDANWSRLGLGGLPGTDGTVLAAVVDGSGNLYIGGTFTNAGAAVANHVAKWDGTNWSALGSGVGGNVHALAVSGTNLYVGGSFTTAGGSAAKYIAKWDGSTWTAVGSGLNSAVEALMVSGSDLYVGGYFTTAGETPARR